MGEIVIEGGDPRSDDVRALLERHLTFAFDTTPAEDVHALDLDGLLDPALTFFTARADGRLVGIGALKQLDEEHAELKSMHTASEARGRGVARAMVAHLVAVARDRGYRRISLETGSTDAFEPARSLYASAGFVEAGPYADYHDSPNSTFMTLQLG